MTTREQYMEREDQQAAHREYYGQFVDDRVKVFVVYTFGLERLLESRDRSFNDIRLSRWDALVRQIPRANVELLKRAGDGLTLCTGVCILKEAGLQAVEQHRQACEARAGRSLQ